MKSSVDLVDWVTCNLRSILEITRDYAFEWGRYCVPSTPYRLNMNVGAFGWIITESEIIPAREEFGELDAFKLCS